MSMYTQLLEAAYRDHPARPGAETDAERDNALQEVLRRRRELIEGLQDEESAETVPALLALEVGYDVALIDLARCVGIDAGPHRFEQPHLEREHLEQELRDKGIPFENADGEQPLTSC